MSDETVWMKFGLVYRVYGFRFSKNSLAWMAISKMFNTYIYNTYDQQLTMYVQLLFMH
jgi:hypothetical protein